VIDLLCLNLEYTVQQQIKILKFGAVTDQSRSSSEGYVCKIGMPWNHTSCR